ncbi:hypothetical protein CHS0354_029374 [Potamilus streckersoni]|nr:hypothetical protein CHS0354_029374 [Potamilus streckersoni]
MEDMAADRKDNSCFLLDVLLPEIMDLNTRCCDVGSKLLLSKAIFQLAQRTCHFLQSGKAHESFLLRLRGDGDVLQKILNFVWTTWEDTVDVIRLTSKDIFDCLISIHLQAVSSRLGANDEDEFLRKLALSLCQEVSWSCKGKYNTLSSLVSHLGSRWLLKLHPGIASEVIDQIQEQTLACYASDLYEKLFTKDMDIDRATWMTTWVDSVVNILCGNSKLQKKLTQEYILPKLLKCGKDTLHYMIQRISSITEQGKSPDGHLGALIMCLRRARAMGLLKNQSQDQSDMWFGLVEVKLIHGALSSSDDQVRLDAFGLLCENQRTTEPVSEVELRLIEFFIPYNLNSQSPAFRQYFLSHVRKFLSRMSESMIALRRDIACKQSTSSAETAAKFLKSYKAFLSWLTRTLLSSLYPGSAFGRRTTCLATLLFITDIFGSSAVVQGKEDLEFDLYEEIQSSEVQTLLEFLSDTFEENKQEAVKILVACTMHKELRIMSKRQMEALFDVALKLSGSTKPQDCTTAAYLFRLLLHQDDCYEILQSQVNKENKLPLPGITNSNFGRRLLLLWILLKYLQDQRVVAEKNLLIAAANRPLYSTIHCIRYILSDVDYRKMEKADEQDWRDFLLALLNECFAIARVVSPVVHNSSPEGNIPVEAIRGSGLDVISLLTEELDVQLMLDAEEVKGTQTVMLMPEYLVVCCWRSIKEISLLLGQISYDVPISDPERADMTGLIDCQQIVSIGEYFQNQLLESKHRGAFELAYAGFVKMTEMLWKSYISVLHHLPSEWLRKMMSDIKSDDPGSRLCATRRSAGIPFYVQALVTTEPTSTGRMCFREAMEELLTLSLTPEGSVGSTVNAKVHALNILRALYRDTRLGEDVTPYITDGLKAAILGFKSLLWAVRNSATLLLGAMMTRIFGVKRSKDESSLSRKNCQTGRSFFHRHPVLYQFLLEQITEATQNISEKEKLHLHPALYPVLMVLGRLFPSPMEGTDSSFQLAAFIPHIIRCALSPVFKIRVMAARAMQPLVDKDQLTSVFCTLIDLLPKSVKTTVIQSHIHGTLLQMKHLLKLVPNVSIATKQELGQKILPAWRDRLWLITRDNACVVTRKEAMEVSERIISLYISSSDLETSMPLLLDFLFTTLSEEIGCLGSLYSLHTPGLSEFYVTVASLYLKLLFSLPRHHKLSVTELESSMQTLLKSSEYEVRKVILAVMKEVLRKRKPVIDADDVSMDADTDDNEDLLDLKEISDFEEKDLVHLIFSSENIYKHLIQMILHNETHHECLVQLLKVLQLHPLSSHTAVLQGQAEQVMMRLLDIIQENSRDEICAAVIHFSGCLVQTLYDSAALDEDGGSSVAMEMWISMLCNHSSSERCPDIQLACAAVIRQNARILLYNPAQCLGQLNFTVWQILVDLLQEDDLEVKAMASDVLLSLDISITGSVQPLCALDLLIGHFVSYHGNRNMTECMKTLLEWIEDTGDDVHVGDSSERLFDKGEMNTYREDVGFIRLIVKHINQLLATIPPITKPFPPSSPPASLNVREWGDGKFETWEGAMSSEEGLPELPRCREEEDFTSESQPLEQEDEVALEPSVFATENFLHSLGLELCRLLRAQGQKLDRMSNLEFKAAFLNPPAYSRGLIEIYKTLVLVNLGLDAPFATSCKQECQDVLLLMKDKISNDRFQNDLLISEALGNICVSK